MTHKPYKSALQLVEKEKERCSYPLRIDVYGNGCEHDCTYCYAREAVKMGGWNTSRNLEHPYPKTADVECLRTVLMSPPKHKPDCVKVDTRAGQNWRQIKALLENRLPLRIGALTDCFQERMEKITLAGLNLLKALAEANYPAQIVTKSRLIATDDYINAMRQNQKNMVVQFSITTASDQVSRAIEPYAPSSSQRFEALDRLIKEGFYTSVRINPLFPMFPDQTLTKLNASTKLTSMDLFEEAKKKQDRTLPIFDFGLVKRIITSFERSPAHTAGKHTLVVGFVRLTKSNLNRVNEALQRPGGELLRFFHLKEKATYYYSPQEIRFYYEAIKELCQKENVPFSICYDSDATYQVFKDLWVNQKDCCNALGVVEGFGKVYSDCS
jgi:DNA repair photolyase